MTYGTELKPGLYTGTHTNYQQGLGIKNHETPWDKKYIEELKDSGWDFVEANTSLIGYHDAKTPQLMQEWAQTKHPVEISIVLVALSTGIENVPARTLAYSATTLNFISALRERAGINIDKLRIMNPCYSNVYPTYSGLQLLKG